LHRNKIPRTIVDLVVYTYKPFSVERKYWTLFRNKYASISDKIQQQIISKEDDVCIFLSYCLKRHAGYQ